MERARPKRGRAGNDVTLNAKNGAACVSGLLNQRLLAVREGAPVAGVIPEELPRSVRDLSVRHGLQASSATGETGLNRAESAPEPRFGERHVRVVQSARRGCSFS